MTGPTILKVTEAVGPLGTVAIVKQSVDVRQVFVDFSKWLAAGETILQLWGFAIQANPETAYPGWQTDFPFTQSTGAVPSDTNPLVMTSAALVSGSEASVEVGNGTAGLSYIFSFLVTSTAARVKEIDILVSINQPVNSSMISSLTPPALSVTAVAGTTALAQGTSGSVNVSNIAAAAITITLPPNPVQDQTIVGKDVAGNASTYAITWNAPSATIDGASTFIFGTDYESATFKWTGSQWSVL